MLEHRHSRRAFLNATGVGAAGLASAWHSLAAAVEAKDADLVVHNAKVYTVDDSNPTAQAFAVYNGRFVAVGSNEEAKTYIGQGTRVIDAKGATIVPGCIDCHNHPVGTTLLYEVIVGNPFEVEFFTIDGIIEKLRAKAARTPPGQWVEGFFFDDTKLKDKRDLNVHDLDKVSTEHPVMVLHRGAHTSYYNSKALQMAGVTKDIKDLPGGTYDRDSNGELNGRITDRARVVFANVGARPVYGEAEQAERERAGMAHISKEFARYGLTTVHHQGGDLTSIQAVRARGELKHRVSYEVSGKMLDAMIDNGIRTGFGDDWIKLGATAEHGRDGSFSERTMAISTNYPGTNYKGNLTGTQEELDAWVERVHRAGIKVNCHANGDVAIASTLTAYERALKAYPVADTRFKITHCTLVNDDLIRRIKAIGAIPAPFTSYAYYNADKFHFYGEEMMNRSMAFRSFLDAGIPVCAGSDFFPGPFSPLMGIQGMVTRKGWNGEVWGANQKVTVAEALRINSYNGAYANHEEKVKGSITPGKLADYLVLADDPHSIDPEKIKDIQIISTVVGGTTMYEA